MIEMRTIVALLILSDALLASSAAYPHAAPHLGIVLADQVVSQPSDTQDDNVQVSPSEPNTPTDKSVGNTVPRTLEIYEVQCGVLSDEGLPEGSRPRFTESHCKLAITLSDSGVTRLDFVGTIDGGSVTWTFEGDAKLGVFKQIAPQTGGKFNRSVRNGLACFVAFDDEGLDDVDSLICYRRSTLRKILSWDRGRSPF